MQFVPQCPSSVFFWRSCELVYKSIKSRAVMGDTLLIPPTPSLTPSHPSYLSLSLNVGHPEVKILRSTLPVVSSEGVDVHGGSCLIVFFFSFCVCPVASQRCLEYSSRSYILVVSAIGGSLVRSFICLCLSVIPYATRGDRDATAVHGQRGEPCVGPRRSRPFHRKLGNVFLLQVFHCVIMSLSIRFTNLFID